MPPQRTGPRPDDIEGDRVMRSATRTSCRPAGSPSADERRAATAFVCGFGDPAAGVGALAWDLGEPGALLLSEAEGSRAATFALEEGGDAATLEITAERHGRRGDREPARRPSSRSATQAASRSSSASAEVDRKDGSQSFQCSGQISRWSADPLEGAGTFRHLAIDAGDQSLLVVESRGEPGAEHGEERTRAWLIQGEDDEPLRGRLHLDPVRRRGQPDAASASSSGPRRPSARAAPRPPGSRPHPRAGIGREGVWAGLFRCQTDGDPRPRQLSALARMSGPDRITTVISDFGGVLTTPLVQSFAAVQDQTGVPFEALANAMAQDPGGGRSPSALRARDGKAHRGRLPPKPRRRSRARPRATGPSSTASARSTSTPSIPTSR